MMYALIEMKMFDLVFEYLVKALLEAMEAVAMIPGEHLNDKAVVGKYSCKSLREYLESSL